MVVSAEEMGSCKEEVTRCSSVEENWTKKTFLGNQTRFFSSTGQMRMARKLTALMYSSQTTDFNFITQFVVLE